MLTELRIRNLGVVVDVTLNFDRGVTALTGETGAGKTMIVEAIKLVTGQRAESHVVRAGCDEAVVEARFVEGDEETILARTIPKEGRSRAYIDGRMAPVSALTQASESLIDLHGQNSSLSLLSTSTQREGLDRFGLVDTDTLQKGRTKLSELVSELERSGGDATARNREADLLRYQLDELDKAELAEPDESEELRKEEDELSTVAERRQAVAHVHDLLGGDRGAVDTLGAAVAETAKHSALEDMGQRLAAALAEMQDLMHEAGSRRDATIDDPARLAAVQERRFLLRQLEKKYGPTLGDVIAFRDQSRQRLAEIENHDENRAALESAIDEARDELRVIEADVLKQRRKAAPKLAAEIEARLHTLALGGARVEVQVGEDDGGDDVVYAFSANPGMPLLPLAKAASGGELSRAMLALRLTLATSTQAGPAGPGTYIFDEVDSGVGGEAALSVGRALTSLGDVQVLVVTHLPQVAALATNQMLVSKSSTGEATSATVRSLAGEEREVELARMLAGRPDSKSGRSHARELLAEKGSQAPKTRPKANAR